jgi:16S rRNA processing protein RimM
MILMGVIGKPHGVRGLVKVNFFSDDAEMFADYPLSDKSGRRFSLEWVSGNIAQLSEVLPAGARKITDRNEAERLTNTELFAPRSALPETEEDEFYFADLVGLEARDEAGKALGKVQAVHDYGAGTSLEIAPGALLVPFTRAAVPVVDVAAGYVVVAPPDEVIAS